MTLGTFVAATSNDVAGRKTATVPVGGAAAPESQVKMPDIISTVLALNVETLRAAVFFLAFNNQDNQKRVLYYISSCSKSEKVEEKDGVK